MSLVWTHGTDPEFTALTQELDTYFRDTLGAQREAAFEPYNAAKDLEEVVLWKENGKAVACAAWKSHPDGQAEVKRVYVQPAYRHGGLARELLQAVEARVAAQGFTRLLLETNPSFTAAVRLYQRYGFQPTEPFGTYACLCTLCMAKPVQAVGVHPDQP